MPEAGTDALGMKTMAVRQGDRYILNGTKQILDKYAVTWMIIPRYEMLAKYLYSIDDDDWQVIYEDQTAVIFRRDD